MSTREQVIHDLAADLERWDRKFGRDTAPRFAEALVEDGYADLAFEALVFAGVPEVAALDLVCEACDRLGLSREIAFTLIAWHMEEWSWP